MKMEIRAAIVLHCLRAMVRNDNIAIPNIELSWVTSTYLLTKPS